MNKLALKVIIFAIATLLLIKFAMSFASSNNVNTDSSNNQPLAHSGYSLTYSEALVLDQLLKEEVEHFSLGQSSLLSEELITTTTAKVAKAYYENQVSADQKYYKKSISLSGYVQSINSGINNQPYLVFYGTTLFDSPQASFKNDPANTISTLRKGQLVHLVCKGAGAIAGTPIFRDCIFAKDYAEQRASEIKAEASEFLRGDIKPSEIVGSITLIAILTARNMPASSPCFLQDQKKCLKEIRKVAKHNLEKKAINLASELKAAGVQINTI